MEDLKWMRVLTGSLLLLLSVTIKEVQGSDENVALNKPAVQSTTYNSLAASNAVNGNTNDFSHTSVQSNQWWRVNLQGQYYIKSMRIFNRRDCCRDRLQQIYILTSNDNTATPQDPHPHRNTAPDWTIRYYIVGPVGDDVSINLYLTEPSRHVAVFSQHDEGVTLAEVEIYSYNGQDAPSPVQTNSPTSSSVLVIFVPARAVDGNINMFDAGSYFSSTQDGVDGATRPHWWRVELQQACDQCSVVVYPYLRLPRAIEDGQFSRLSAFSIFSSNSQTPGVPNTSQNGWTTCLDMSGSVDQRGPIRAQCSQNNTRWIAVYKNTLEALELTEVQVFQREPTFSSGSSVTVTGMTTGCVEISWPAADRASSYRWKCTQKSWSSQQVTQRPMNVCGYSADTPVSCSVLAVGSGGVSSSIDGTGRTACTGPTFTLTDGFPNNRRINIQNIQLRCSQATQFTLAIHEGESGLALGIKHITSSLSQHREFNNLEPNQRYRVEGYTTRSGQTSPSTTRYLTTPETPSERVSSLTVTPISPYCVSLSWNPPTQSNGVITNYKYKCGDKNEMTTGSASVRTGEQCRFPPYQSVTCPVWAVNGAGDGAQDNQTVSTFCAAPTNVRLSLADGKSAVNGKDRRKITASIEAGVVPNCARIQRFTFEFRKTEGPEVIQTEEFVSPYQNRGSVRFTDLDAVSNYKVVVIAVNDKGNQSLPAEESVETGELKPDTAPAGFTFQTNASCVEMSWGPPVEPNGFITLYQGTCRINSTEVTPFNTASQNHVLCGFPSATKVYCVVAASTSEGFGPEAGFNRSIGVDATEKSLGEPSKTSESTIQITIPQVIFTNKNTNLRYYLVIVQEVNENAASDGKRRKRELTTKHPVEEVTTSRLPQIDQDLLYNFTDAKAHNLTYYVTLRLEDKKQDVGVTIGDGSSSSGYYNRPLEPGKDYKLHYSYTVELDGRYLTTVVFNDQLYRTAETDGLNSKSSLVALAALVILPAVLIPVAVIFIWKRRQRTKDHEKRNHRDMTSPSTSGLGDNSQKAADYSTISLELVERENDGRDYAKLVTVPTYENTQPSIRDQSIEDPIYSEPNMTSASDSESSKKEARIVAQEFTLLKARLHGDMEVGKLPANKSRNRNRKVLPFDDYRVVLSGNIPCSDYINATYYNGMLPRNRYIAAMGPMKTTTGDFWQMIWQENVAVIVMITQLKEGSKTKCSQYWPDLCEDNGQSYNGITVKCVKEEMFAHFRMRKITLYKGEHKQEITQLHFQEWEEMKTPKSTDGFLTFYDEVESIHARHNAAPLLVQSSCGAGRAGTFLAIHDLLTYGRRSNGVNVYECVRKLRDRRPEMVQTEAQYTFIYEILKLRNIRIVHEA